MPTTIAKDLNAKENTANFYGRMSIEIVNGLVKVREMGKYGLASIKGDMICPCIYDEIEVINDNFKVKVDKYWGIMDAAGKLLCPCNYVNPLQVDEGGLYCEMDEDVYYIRFKR